MTFAIRRFHAGDVATHRADLVKLLVDAVNQGASMSFVAPLSEQDAGKFWDSIVKDLESGHIVLVAALDHDKVIGSAQLVLAWQPNGQHRAEVVKLLVRSDSRRRGIGTLLMRTLEEQAHALNRWLLVLDTEEGGDGENLYDRLGYTRVGTIPKFALNSDGSAYIATILYYKLLR